MKKWIAVMALLSLILTGCAPTAEMAQVAATTLPVYEFTAALCEGTDISVARVVTERVSCLHDYALSVSQVQLVEGAELVVLSGGGLEDFMTDILEGKHTVDASAGLDLLHSEHDHEHEHESDAHYWLSPECAKQMAQNICAGLSMRYPRNAGVFRANLTALLEKIDALQAYGQEQLSQLHSREMITFHDGFAYFAESFDLTILKAIEEESGSEASAAELIELIEQTRQHQLKAVFTEKNGSVSAAGILAAETGVKVFQLDMAMSGESWFDAMYHNIDTVKEALE